LSQKAKRLLDIADTYPELREGIVDTDVLDERADEIKLILEDTFNPILTLNEIKTVSVPFHNVICDDFELEMKNMPMDQTYIIACTIILTYCYDHTINFKRPFYYEIPDANGITRYYKILYNADFIEIIPAKNAPEITQDDINELLDNFENVDLWKEKFPKDSYIFKGFVISNIFDVTDDQSISNIKSSLIGEDKRKNESFMNQFYDIFRSLFGLKNLEVGFSE